MSKSFLFMMIAVFFSLAVRPVYWLSKPVPAQGSKPSQALKRYVERQRDLQEDFDKEVSDGKAQFHDWEPRAETLRAFAASESAGFNIADWKGDELLALASLYQQADLFAKAAEAYRAHLRTEPKSRFAENVRLALARALIESNQYEEAQNLLDELFLEMPENPVELSLRVGLYKDLTAVWRDQGKYDWVIKQARRGYDLAENTGKFRRYEQQMLETTVRDQMSLAALLVSAQERRGFKEDADKFHSRVIKRDFKSFPDSKAFYLSELTISRLYNTAAPDLDVAEWLNGASELRPQNITDRKGRVILLDYWAMWCSPCLGAFPHWRDYLLKYSGKGFEIVGATKFYGRSDVEDGLSREQELKSLQSFKAKHNLAYPIAVGRMDDVTNEELFGVAGLPTIILIDRRGNIRHITRGVEDYRDLEKRIEQLVNEN
ncbi:MAG: redoxin family protein [Blastocatellales bacterium]